MADAIYTTRPGDMLDYICWKHYGSSSGYVEAILEHARNYRLSDQPDILPGEVNIFLPEIRLKEPQPIRLWDQV